ncbi:Uncharacterized protein SCF082_LOCUS47864 [Durusdinium trenchii]|uniref:Uncharacterized protein n=1 Tax=Durusdinium trenchii TaxID=1381693 RepID=A0ABP0RP37_9DINO
MLHALCFANVASGHAAPPCGTSSRARDKPLPQEMRHVRAPPLRSEAQPLGMSDLTPQDQARVHSANQLYAFTALAVLILSLRNAMVSVENPSRSYFWLVMLHFAESNSCFSAAWHSLQDVHFQACAHGGTRATWKCWRSTPGVFDRLRQRCPGGHRHESFKPSFDKQLNPVFPTQEEAAYPAELCHTHALALVAECSKRGAQFPNSAFDPQGALVERSIPTKHGIRALPPIVSEYAVVTDQRPQSLPFKQLSKLPSFVENGESRTEGKRAKVSNPRKTEIRLSQADPKELFGVFREPEVFVDAALTAKHPIDYAFPLPDALLEAVAKLISDGPKLTIARRKLALKKIQVRADRLRAQELELHASLDPRIAKVVEGKSLLLWKELLEETSFDDPNLFDEFCKGFKVTGKATHCDEFPHGFQPPLRSVEDLKQNSVWLKKRSIGKCKSSGNLEMDRTVWSKTLKERDCGWICGPFTEQEVDAQLGHSQWLATRRFGLQQPNKVRLIDNCLSSGVNSAFSGTNKLTLLGVDALASLVLCVMNCVSSSTRFNLVLSGGNGVAVEPSPLWGGKLELLGRTVDLESAYKQVAASPDDDWAKVIGLAPLQVCTASTVSASQSGTSLVSFSTSGALTTTMTIRVWTQHSGSQSFEGLLKALGWKFDSEGPKATRYNKVFDVLGIRVDLSCSQTGVVTLENKPTRAERLLEQVATTLTEGRVHSSLAATLHGQLNFVQSFYSICNLKPAMMILSDIANSGWKAHHAKLWAIAATYLVYALKNSPPRSLSLQDEQRPILVFSDGAWEPENSVKAGAGIVFVDPVRGTRIVNEVDVDPRLITRWLSMGKTQIIAELELLPVLAGLSHYADAVRGRRVLWFVDNNSVRDMLAKGSSPAIQLFTMLVEVGRLTHIVQAMIWYSRVPSKSNIADLPSRQLPEQAARLIKGIVGPKLSLGEDLVKVCVDAASFIDFMEQIVSR